MSTRNITGMNPARRANAAVAESAIARAEELAVQARRIREQRDQDVQNAQIAARALEQEANDQLAVIGEEVGQVAYIVNGDVEPAPAALAPPVDEPPAQPEPPVEPLPEEPPAQPDAQTVVLPEQPEPQEAIGLPPARDVPRRNVFIVIRDHFSSWSATSWVFAVIFLAVTLLVMLTVYPGFFPDRPDVVRGIVGFIVLPITFFMIGGWIGSMIDRARARRQTAVEVLHEDAG
jgi:hypothetical protein